MMLGLLDCAPILCLLVLVGANEHISNHLEHDELVINRKYATNETHKETKREGDDMVLFCEYTVAGGSATANRLPESFEWRHNGVVIRATSPSS
uniref:Ig-like domain-containing protein n=1 Tax=Romanomermis culicivorax TaxID=13658 RepID=A0A915L546_ROMCU